MKTTSFFAAFLIALGTFNVFAAVETSIKSTPSQGQVEFEAIGKPSMLKIKGKGEGLTSDLKIVDGKLNGQMKFNVDTLNTGINMRDSHMKEKYLQTKEYPEAILTLKDQALPATWTVKSPMLKDMNFKGTLKLHGVEQEITGQVSIDSAKLNGSAKFEVKLSDFKIDIPEYMGVKVADMVKVNITLNEMTATETEAKAAVEEKPAAPADAKSKKPKKAKGK